MKKNSLWGTSKNHFLSFPNVVMVTMMIWSILDMENRSSIRCVIRTQVSVFVTDRYFEKQHGLKPKAATETYFYFYLELEVS